MYPKTYQQGMSHIVLAPAISTCPLCENKLHVRKTMNRELKGKSAVFKAKVKELHCTNPDCKLHQVSVKPEGLSFFYLPHMVYGIDVVFFVGEKKLKDWLYKQIREVLDVKPAVSSLSRFFHLFEQLAQCFLETQEEETKAIIKKQRSSFFNSQKANMCFPLSSRTTIPQKRHSSLPSISIVVLTASSGSRVGLSFSIYYVPAS